MQERTSADALDSVTMEAETQGRPTLVRNIEMAIEYAGPRQRPLLGEITTEDMHHRRPTRAPESAICDNFDNDGDLDVIVATYSRAVAGRHRSPQFVG